MTLVGTNPYSSGAASAAALRAVITSEIGRPAPRITGLEETWMWGRFHFDQIALSLSLSFTEPSLNLV